MDSPFLLGLVCMIQGGMIGSLVGLLAGYPRRGRRLIRRSLVDWVRSERDGCCLYGWFYRQPCPTQALHVHHIQKRAQLGDDHPANLITLCAFHHDQAEQHLISPAELLHILTATGADKEEP